MPSLLSARDGGLVTDADGDLAVHVVPGALEVDTLITIVRDDDPPAVGGYEVLRTWRVDAYPSPVALNAKASLSHRAVQGVPEDKLRFFLRPGSPSGPIPTDGWQSIAPVPLGDTWVDGRIWFLPPAHTAPPRSTYSYVCLVRKP